MWRKQGWEKQIIWISEQREQTVEILEHGQITSLLTVAGSQKQQNQPDEVQ